MLDQGIMREATRLTRAGQLIEATALLQRMLRGAGTPAAASSAAARPAPRRLSAPTIDGEATRIGERARSAAPDAAAQVRTAERTAAQDSDMPLRGASALARKRFVRRDGLRDLPGIGLRGPALRMPAAHEIAPEGARFIQRSFSNAAGHRSYKLLIPSRTHGHPLPLIVMLHGCTQSPDDFAAGTRMNFAAEAQGCFVVYPEQPSGANPSRCWNWFRTGDQQRDGGEPSLIAGITRQVMQDHAIDPKRVYVAGLSAGGAAAAIMAATYPDLYAAAGIHSGLACGAARDLPSALMAMRQGGAAPAAARSAVVPTIVFHGDRDTTVHPANGDQIAQSTNGRGTASVARGRVPGGHAYTRTVLTDRGQVTSEHWIIHGAAHAWSGGSPAGSYTDPNGPDATREMLRFFLAHARG
ncbi:MULTISPECIES: alpha/beta hydrolase family esterase [Bradyrhizobium]|jgi:poly(hydroxyalkanoate) depolymerase family esterase|uniref:PHB depolymerase family esterase n=1 Tax=Bradyrhizobium denitrificans TaxID=2734912 RepID=A0ABS5G8C5_9BRAD|nr:MULTISPECIES: PHB depolymerase family esterase [Bradyrhizobium]MBR1137584.1 PHB depolymerase family esterase [Bradyrhizobium denitrificans]MDU1493353.1 PHB depolymerase family esterase [Bradyrhizobium sp.]MDU1543691.1 PHB depolymerase family esterase [Bradyrhizobium sp.]MDU1668605.1 PHB depolymerase family esterase [Bradyrhizobium sp.]MDU1691883.1 PHB depolymerase family esterase [Bradyrhizobium sp.]